MNNRSALKTPLPKLTFLKGMGALLIALLAGIIVRSAFFATYTVIDNSMLPTLAPGDKILSNKFTSLINWSGGPSRDELITFEHPLYDSKHELKRVVGKGGDTLSISKGKLYINGSKHTGAFSLQTSFIQESPFHDPRIEFEPYIIPKPNDTLYLENMSVREFQFAVHIMKQEQPEIEYLLTCNLMLNEKIVSDSNIAKFFKLSMDSSKTIDLNSYSWIDLANLEIQLSNRFPKENISFKRSLYQEGEIVEYYIVKNDNYFVTGDNLSLSYDSRYWGVVNANKIKSKPFIVYWSHKPNSWFEINFSKLLKLVN